MTHRIPFNRPFVAGKELFYIAQAVTNGQLAADGVFTKRCQTLFQERFQIPRVLLTPSCTAALELAASLVGLEPGDEVILPSFTFVSTANAVVRLGAKPVFVDVRDDTLNMDETKLESLVSSRTKAIVPVHYGGVACEMDPILELAQQRGLCVIEDAAQGVGARYKGRPLGGLGALGAYSFHETKNVICGEGGALCVNDLRYLERAEILRDKGTNRQKFLRGQVDKYTWVDVGSSHVPSEIASAFLWGQLEHMDEITSRRAEIYHRYREAFSDLEQREVLRLPRVPGHCDTNFHLFYLLLRDQASRDRLMERLQADGILAVFHYVPLHTAPMGRRFGYGPGSLPQTEDLSGRLLRLPVFFDLSESDQSFVIERVRAHLAR